MMFMSFVFMCLIPGLGSRFGQKSTQPLRLRTRKMSAGASSSAEGALVGQRSCDPHVSTLRCVGHSPVRLCAPSADLDAWDLADGITMERKPIATAGRLLDLGARLRLVRGCRR